MKLWFAAPVLCASIAFAQEAVPLFNGKDLDGWEIKAGKKDVWSVVDGSLVCKGGGGGWIGTTKTFGDYTLHVEWKVPANGNSGVFLRVPDAKGDPAYTGFEIQVLDDEGPEYKGKLKDWQYSGSVYALSAPTKKAYKHGEWNTYDITFKGDVVTIVLNGEKVNEFDVTKNEKSAKRPKSGFIGFQNHGSGVEYKNITIKTLDK